MYIFKGNIITLKLKCETTSLLGLYFPDGFAFLF